MRVIARVAILLSAFTASVAFACGYCVEDKIAAVYDHAVATRAFAEKHQVAFFGIDGQLTADEKSRREIEAVVRDIPGLDKGSARVSLESAALSVAFDPRRIGFAALQRSLERKLSPLKLTLLPMRVMDEPARMRAAPK